MANNTIPQNPNRRPLNADNIVQHREPIENFVDPKDQQQITSDFGYTFKEGGRTSQEKTKSVEKRFGQKKFTSQRNRRNVIKEYRNNLRNKPQPSVQAEAKQETVVETPVPQKPKVPMSQQRAEVRRINQAVADEYAGNELEAPQEKFDTEDVATVEQSLNYDAPSTKSKLDMQDDELINEALRGNHTESQSSLTGMTVERTAAPTAEEIQKISNRPSATPAPLQGTGLNNDEFLQMVKREHQAAGLKTETEKQPASNVQTVTSRKTGETTYKMKTPEGRIKTISKQEAQQTQQPAAVEKDTPQEYAKMQTIFNNLAKELGSKGRLGMGRKKAEQSLENLKNVVRKNPNVLLHEIDKENYQIVYPGRQIWNRKSGKVFGTFGKIDKATQTADFTLYDGRTVPIRKEALTPNGIDWKVVKSEMAHIEKQQAAKAEFKEMMKPKERVVAESPIPKERTSPPLRPEEERAELGEQLTKDENENNSALNTVIERMYSNPRLEQQVREQLGYRSMKELVDDVRSNRQKKEKFINTVFELGGTRMVSLSERDQVLATMQPEPAKPESTVERIDPEQMLAKPEPVPAVKQPETQEQPSYSFTDVRQNGFPISGGEKIDFSMIKDFPFKKMFDMYIEKEPTEQAKQLKPLIDQIYNRMSAQLEKQGFSFDQTPETVTLEKAMSIAEGGDPGSAGFVKQES